MMKLVLSVQPRVKIVKLVPTSINLLLLYVQTVALEKQATQEQVSASQVHVRMQILKWQMAVLEIVQSLSITGLLAIHYVTLAIKDLENEVVY